MTSTLPETAVRPAAARPPAARRRRTTPARFLLRGAVVLAITWVPAGLGAVGVGVLHRWAVLSGFLGVSWLLPAVFVRAAAHEWARLHRLPGCRGIGLAAGAVAAGLLLFAAASAIGANG